MAALTSALSSMEVMLDALMQRGIGKPEEPKPKEDEEPPALPTRPTGRGRLPALRGTAAAPWNHRPVPPPTQEEGEEKSLVNLELERRAAKAEEAAKQKEEEMKQKEEEMRQKEELISTLQRQVEHYESRLSECEVRMKSVEEELQRQITSLQKAQTAGGRRDGASTKHGQESSFSRGDYPPSPRPSTMRRPQRGSERAAVVIDTSTADDRTMVAEPPVNQLATREIQTTEVSMPPPPPSPSGARSVEELKTMKRQFVSWKKEYEARLKKAKTELKRLAHAEKKSNGGGGGNGGNGDSSDGHAHRRRCGWWRFKAPKCRAPKCCSFKLPSPRSCCCCFRR